MFHIIILGKSRCYFEDIIEYIKLYSENTTESFGYEEDKINLLFGVHEVCKEFYPYLPKNILIFNTEQLDYYNEWTTKNYISVLKNYPVIDYCKYNQEWIKDNLKINTKLFKFDKPLNKYSTDKSIRDIDILFYGTYTERRKEIYEDLKNYFGDKLNIVFRFELWGDEKTELINRSKIILNLIRYDTKLFQIVRVFPLLYTDRIIISEECIDQDDYKELKDVIFTDNIIDSIKCLPSLS